MRRLLGVGLMGLGVLCGCGEDDPPAPGPTTPAAETAELIHLVGDAGLTGTRFCVFISRGETTSTGRTCSEPREFRIFPDDDGGEPTHCISKSSYDIGSTKLPPTATGGIQDLVDDPDKARELVEKGVAEVESALRERDKKLTGAAILGTSGFRDDHGEIIPGKYDGIWTAIAPVFSSRGIPLVTRALHLEEEARWSWMTIRFLRLQNQAFSIIESGGGGCHFATGASQAEFGSIESASDPFGLTRTWQTYAAQDVRQEEIPALIDPTFKPCYSGTMADGTGQDATACVELLRTRLFASSSMARTAASVAAEGRPLYGTGPAWNGLFHDYFKGKASVTVKDIHDAAVAECALPQKDAHGFIKHQSCFFLAFQEAFLRTAGGGDQASIRNGIESWPRGASISPGGEFATCKDSTIKVTIDPEEETPK